MVNRLLQLNKHFEASDVADVVIIGAGIAGISTAVNLKKRGVEKIVIVDSSEKVGGLKKASTVNCGIMCSQALYSPDPLAMELLRLSQEATKDIHYLKYDPSGSLYPCMTHDDVTWAKNRA